MKNKKQQDWTLIGIVIMIILVIITWGLATRKAKREELADQKESQAKLDEIQTATELIELQKNLDKVNQQLIEKYPSISLKEKSMRRVLLYVRIWIGALLITINLVFLLFTFSSSSRWDDVFSNQLNLNEGILLVYSFGALVIYGSPSKFSSALKARVLRKLKKEHLFIKDEISELESQKEALIQRICYLKNQTIVSNN
jgi:hypothetical protein